MPNPDDPFAKSNYVSGTTTTTSVSTPPKLVDGGIDLNSSQTKGAGKSNVFDVIEQARYGTGKPCRVVIRGKIASA
jgi:hypothetical protein